MNLRRTSIASAPPLALPQVLEEEYVRLHGPLPADYPASGSNEARLAAIHGLIHAMPRKRIALCVSGGGIRSATFGLGILQGLARLKLLSRFDYLSTVSGGGYIGSWLTAWIHHHPRGLAGVQDELRNEPRRPEAVEAEPIAHLRTFSNYLSPQLGLLSPDSWTLVGTYLRNLILNWLVLLPFLFALLAVPLLYRASTVASPPEIVVGAFAVFGSLLLLISLTYLHLCRPSLSKLRRPDRWERFERQQSFLLFCLFPLLAGVTCLTLAWRWHELSGHPFESLALFGFSALPTLALGAGVMHAVAWLAAAVILRRPWGDGWRYLELLTIVLSGLLGGGFLGLALKQTAPLFARAAFPDWYACGAVPGFLSLFLLAATLFIGIASRSTGDGDREWWGRAGSWVLIGAVGWTGAAGLALFGPWVLSHVPAWITSAGGITGLLTLLAGFSAKTAATQAEADPQWWKRAGAQCYVVVLAPLTAALLLALLAWGNAAILKTASAFEIGQYIVGMALFAVLMSFYININKFSLHAMYRNRLIRAYLGASRGNNRAPNPFTGFDPNDNFQMADLAPAGGPVQRPFHVVNIALNLVRGRNLAWQQRKAQSFTVTPLHCGSAAGNLGYRRSFEYGKNHAVNQAITIGTALTISGAAASPNMGYHSSPAVAFLLTLFNVRLGWWLGNPGEAGRTTYGRSCPEFAVGPLLAEALGLTDERKRYVYLSDGGHFENLGLYEMVLRRCHVILVSDAGCDRQSVFSDLGNAIRKIRIDLGIDIELDLEGLRQSEGTPQSPCHHAVGAIRYDLVDANAPKGLLIYVKPSLTGHEPADILDYAARHTDFPHESTADQFFDESQFESYRALGTHIVHEVFDGAGANPNRDDDRVFEDLRNSRAVR